MKGGEKMSERMKGFPDDELHAMHKDINGENSFVPVAPFENVIIERDEQGRLPHIALKEKLEQLPPEELEAYIQRLLEMQGSGGP